LAYISLFSGITVKIIDAWIHVQFGSTRTAYYKKANQFFGGILGGAQRHIIVENNTACRSHLAVDLVGSNNSREFSGWTEGLALVKKQPNESNGWYVFTNDTYAHHRFFWGVLATGFLSTIKKHGTCTRPAIIGDVLPQGMFTDVSGNASPYISTYFFLINAAALKLLEWDLVAEAPLEWIASSPDAQLFAPSCPAAIRSFLTQHLCTPGSSIAWHSATPLTNETTPILRSKSRAVIMEHYLSKRATELGIENLPILARHTHSISRTIRSLEVRLLQ
jgi:hypothetical protein